MENENPKTVNARENANTIKPGIKLNVLKVNHAKLIIKIHERHKSIILFDNFTYFEEKRLNPTTIKLIFTENIGFSIIKLRIKQTVRKIPDNVTKYALIKITPIDLILGKNEQTIKNNPITKTLIEIVISRLTPIETK